MAWLKQRATARRTSSASVTASQQQQVPRAAAAAMFADVPLAKRVNHHIEWSGIGILLDIASAALSLLTVLTYMIETHYSEDDAVWLALRIVDQICSVIFAAEWSFWLWLSRNRLGYILSWQSLVDIVTIVPIFVSLFVSKRESGFATFEAMVRIFRVVRVFRIFRLGKRLKSEVLSRLLTLVFTLLAIIVTAAGIFFELETKFSDKYPHLTIEQSVYWSLVTVTTIGYGDFTPSITASQMTLLAMLLIAFTLLPYQTSMLVNALSETSVYQSAHYSRATRGHHVVVTGHLAATSAAAISAELFHPDSGFADYNIVFLNPSPPTDAMKRLLKTSQHSHRLLYLQGSWVSQEDLARAQVDACDAVFILCNKSPPDAKHEDLQTVMACLAIGQYIHRKEMARLRHGPQPLLQRLLDLVRRFLLYLQKAQHHGGLPRMCVQLLLPQSKQHLQHLLSLYNRQGLMTTPEQTPHDSNAVMASQGVYDAAATISKAGAAVGKQQDNQQGKSVNCAAADGSGAGGTAWWQHFSRQVTCICITELRFGLLAQSCMGCSGAITLVSNLVRSMDDGVLTQAEFEQLPEWAQEYLEGGSNELYEVAAFPACLHGEAVADVAQYLLDVYRALLLATVHTSSAGSAHPADMAGTAVSNAASTGCPSAAAAFKAPAYAACAGQQQSFPDGGNSGLLLCPLSLGHAITRRGTAYVIASDVRVVLDIMESTAEDYDAWRANKAQQEQQQQQSPQSHTKPLAKHSMAYAQPAVSYGVWKARAVQRGTSGGVTGSASDSKHAAEMHKQQQQHAVVQATSGLAVPNAAQPCWAAPLLSAVAEAGASQLPPGADWAEPAPAHAADVEFMSAAGAAAGSSAHGMPPPTAAAATAAGAGVADSQILLQHQSGEAAQQHGSCTVPPACQSSLMHQPRPVGSCASSRRSTAEQSSRVSSFRRASGATTALVGTSARSLLAALPGVLGAEDGAHSRQRRQRGAIQLNTRGAAALTDSIGSSVEESSQYLLQGGEAQPGLPGPKATPSQRRRTAMELNMQQLYHTRDLSQTAGECLQEMVEEEVPFGGHVLVCSCGTPPAALACLLKPLRSMALPAAPQPVVVLDTSKPSGPEWEELARLRDVYHVRGSVQDPDALIRAGADTAATAVVLLPWSQSMSSAADIDDVVTAGMVDARIIAVVRQLRALNPFVQVFCELSQCQSLRFLDSMGSLLDSCAVDDATAAAASPAFMCGAVLLPLMDVLVCQAVNNRGTLKVLSDILSSWHHKGGSSSSRLQDHHVKPHAAAGLATEAAAPQQHEGRQPADIAAPPPKGSSEASNLTAAQPIVVNACRADVVAEVTAGCSSDGPQQDLKQQLQLQQHATQLHGAPVLLLQVPVKVQHAECCSTFGELFNRLLQEQGMLCCGLYRQSVHYGRTVRYVYTNPHKDTLLQSTDQAFVLAVPHR